MAQITTLTDRQSGAPLYPVTSTKAVFSDAGEDLDALLAGQKQNFQNLLRYYAQKTDLADGLAKKQNSLSTSEDLQITDGNLLSLTAMAKKRLFIDLYNSVFKGKKTVYGKYDPENAPDTDHPFMAYDLWLTYEEAINVVAAGKLNNLVPATFYYGANIRTHLPDNINVGIASGSRVFQNCKMETIYQPVLRPGDNCFNTCQNLKSLTVYDQGLDGGTAFVGCLALETLTFFNLFLLGKSLNIRQSPKISLASLQRIVSQTTSDTTLTTVITVHQNVYAKLTGDTTNEAAAALTPEESAQWQQVLLDAIAKNISFATV